MVLYLRGFFVSRNGRTVTAFLAFTSDADYPLAGMIYGAFDDTSVQ